MVAQQIAYHNMKNTICNIPDCTKPVIARGWCSMHYKRWQMHGDPDVLLMPQEFHGMAKSAEYRIWTHIKDRCNNPSNIRYKDYGGRGISVKFKSFQEFYEEVGKKPATNLTIDRIDNDGNYEPGNLRWATHAQQNSNKRMYKSNKLGVRGVSLTRNGNYRVRKSVGNGKQKVIGTFKTLAEARRFA